MKCAFVLLALASAANRDVAVRDYYTYLGDVTPAESSVGWGSFQVNRNWYMDGFRISNKGVTKKFATGVFAHAPSSIVYDLSSRYNQFTGSVGLDDGSAEHATFTPVEKKCRNAKVVASVLVDKKLPKDGSGGPFVLSRTGKNLFKFKVDLSKKQELRLVTAYAANNKVQCKNNAGAEVAWVDAKLKEDPEIECLDLGEILPTVNSVGWGSYWVNKNWYMSGFMIGGVRYSTGVFAHAKSDLRYNLDERTSNGERRWATFSFCVGLDDNTHDETCKSQGVDFKVNYLKNKMKVYKKVKRGDPARCDTIKLLDGDTETSELRLRAHLTNPKQKGQCDEAEWVNARVCMDRSMVNCTVSKWGPYSACDRSCGSGTKVRTRTVLQRPKFGGLHCPGLQDISRCNESPCPIDCQLGPWSKWSDVSCTQSCGGGKKFRYRGVQRHHSFGGKECGATKQEKRCNTHACPGDCTFLVNENTDVSGFSKWSECSVSCGGGSMTRSRVVKNEAVNGGRGCGAKREVRKCNTHQCPVDCVLAGWGRYTQCSASCGTGFRIRKRAPVTKPVFGGKGCGVQTQIDECNKKSCPIDCEVSSWSAAHACSHTCGSYGTQIRHRSINIYPAYGGNKCPHLSETKECGTMACPVDCLVSTFGQWTTCSKSCGRGEHARRRTVRRQVSNGGKACPHLLEMRKCNKHACPIDCQVGEWGPFGPCPKTCGGGKQVRTRQRTVVEKHGGKACPEEMYTETRYCETQACPSDCKYSKWSKWSKCSKTCGSAGRKTRRRKIVSVNHFGGKGCPALNQKVKCNQLACPVDCAMSKWSEYTVCSKSCTNKKGNGGWKKRTREVFTKASYGGKACPKQLEQEVICNEQKMCPIDCESDGWTAGECSATCGMGLRKSTRKVTQKAMYGGASCGAMYKTMPCHASKKCPTDCVVSEWTPFSQCSSACYDASKPMPTKTRTRHVVVGHRAGGKPCPEKLEQTVTCNEQRPCAVHCEVTDFGDWGSCSRSCGTGIQLRTREYKKDRNGNELRGNAEGNACPAMTDARSCNVHECPIDCAMTEWGQWDECTAKCGQGFQYRTRSILGPIKPINGGKACGEVQEMRFCNTGPCPIDCKEGAFASFKGAMCLNDKGAEATCGPAKKRVQRKILVKPQYGGKACDATYKYKDCSLKACPINCQYMPWSTSQWSACTVSCGYKGKQVRRRSVKVIAQFGGKKCDRSGAVQERVCKDSLPCAHQCKLSAWTYTDCSASCGTGTKTATAKVIPFDAKKECSKLTKAQCAKAKAAYYATCPETTVTEKCAMESCPVDCQVGKWNFFTACSKTCGGGFRRRARQVLQPPANGGKSCGATAGIVKCNTEACPIDCVVSEWSEFGACTKTCGGVGSMRRVRTVTTEAVNGGVGCPSLRQVKSCNMGACPVDCLTSHWTKFSKCTVSCGGGGTKTRFRKIVQRAMNGGECGALTEEVACGSRKCPVDCEMSAFGPFTQCTKKCSGGVKSRTREILTPAANGGKKCGNTFHEVKCNTFSCMDLSKVGYSGEQRLPTIAPTKGRNAQGAYNWHKNNHKSVEHGNVDHIKEQKALKVQPTLSPTLSPTSNHKLGHCMNGPWRVPVGWHGAGYGANFCNLCKCTTRYDTQKIGQLQCQRKQCSKVEAGKVCSATTCKFVYSFVAKKEIMVVKHNTNLGEEQNGSHHRCAYSVGPNNNKAEGSVAAWKNKLADQKTCVCLCYGTRYLQAEQPRLGSDRTTNKDLFGKKGQEKQNYKSAKGKQYLNKKETAAHNDGTNVKNYYVGKDGMLGEDRHMKFKRAEPMCSGDHQIVKTFSTFSSGGAQNCEHRHHYLYEYKGADCLWTSAMSKIAHPHGYESMFVRFLTAEYGNLEDTDFLAIRLRACKTRTDCSSWGQTVKLQDDIMGWRWTYVSGSAVNGHFNGNKDWINRVKGISADDQYVQVQVRLRSSQDYYERHILDNLQIFGHCASEGRLHKTPAPTGYPTRRAVPKTKYPTSAPTPTPTATPTPAPTVSPTPSPTWNGKQRGAAFKKNAAFKKSIPKKIANYPESIQTALNAEVKAWTNSRYEYTAPHSGKINKFQAFYGNMNKFYAMEVARKEANFQKAWTTQERHTFFNAFFYYVKKYNNKPLICKQIAAPLEANQGVVMWNQTPCKALKTSLDAISQKALKAANGEIWNGKKRNWM